MSTVKKHRNKRGEWVPCGATKRACRYKDADSHKEFPAPTNFSSPEEVFAQIDAAQSQPTNQADNVTEDESTGSKTYTISPTNMREALRRLEKANSRLERAGLDGRYTWEENERIELDEEDGNEYTVIDLAVHQPEIINNGWTFVGRIDAQTDPDTGEVYYISKSIGEHQIGEDQASRGNVCDQCGQNRDRHKTYIVKNNEGEVKKVGSSCLKDFLTIRPQGLWALEGNPLDNATFQHDGSSRHSSRDMMVRPRNIIAIALALTEGGENFVSATNYGDRTPTRNLVSEYLFGRDGARTRSRVSYEEYLTQADEIMSTTTFNGEEDYSRNMNNLLSREHVPVSTLGYVVSTIGAHRRQQNANNPRVVREKARGFIAEVGEQIPPGIEAKVEVVHPVPGYGYYSPDSLMLVMRTNDNKVVKWTTSSQAEDILALKKGTIISLDKGKVKEHSSFNDEDQTVIKNGRLRITSTELEED